MTPQTSNARFVLLCVCVTLAFSLTTLFSNAQCIAPPMRWQNATLISGTAGAENAIYRFPSVTKGVNAEVKITGIVNGATLQSIDDNTYGYAAAWQPVVKTPTAMGASESYISFEIKFKDSAQGNAYNFACFQLSFIDIDGDGQHVKEFVAVKNPSFFTTSPLCLLNISYLPGNTIKATGLVANYNNIDTSAWSTNINYIFLFANRVNEVRIGSITDATFTPQERLTCGFFAQLTVPLTVLPVTMVSFTGELNTNITAKLNWITSSETNSHHFEIERSIDGVNFEQAGIVNSATAGGIANRAYAFTDVDPILKKLDKVYYRLKQVDKDARYTYSAVVTLKITGPAAGTALNVYPMPFNSKFTVAFQSSIAGNGIVTLTNMFGQKVFEQKVGLGTGANNIEINNLLALPKGNYVATLAITGQNTQSAKIVKQ